jgi:hypothetical protein
MNFVRGSSPFWEKLKQANQPFLYPLEVLGQYQVLPIELYLMSLVFLVVKNKNKNHIYLNLKKKMKKN